MLKIFKKNFNPREDYSLRFWLANLILGDLLRSFIVVSLQAFIMNLNNNLNEIQEILADPNYSNSARYWFIDSCIKAINSDEERLGKDVYDIFSA